MQPDNTVPPVVQETPQPIVAPIPQAVVAQAPVSQQVVSTANPGQVIYASFWRRFFAYLMDMAIVMGVFWIISFIVSMIAVMPLALTAQKGSSSLPTGVILVMVIEYLFFLVAGVFYFVFFIGKRGQTLGKMALKIKVVKVGTNEVPGYGKAFMREILGKFVSGLVLDLGYFSVLWDKDKQGWHDKIAGSVVIKV